MSSLHSLASIATASGAAGFGWSGGRSAWRSVEKNAGFFILAALVIAGAGLAGYYLRRGSGRGAVGAFFLVLVPAMLLLLVSFAAAGLVAAWAGASPMAFAILLGWQCVAFLVGMVIAAPVRRQRHLAWEIEAENEEFLREIGFRDVGGREGTWLDDEDRELVIHDQRADALIFRIKEKRGGRSRILLDDDGRMLEYVPG